MPLNADVRSPMRVLRDIAITVCVSLLTVEGAGYISPLYYQAIVRFSSKPGWSTPRFAAVWILELVAWAVAAIILAALLRRQRWYWWALGAGAFGTFLAWPLVIITMGGLAHETLGDRALLYGHSCLPLLGAALGTAVWLAVSKRENARHLTHVGADR